MNGGPLGEALKLTLGCLKEGFNFYQHLGMIFLLKLDCPNLLIFSNLEDELAFIAPSQKI